MKRFCVSKDCNACGECILQTELLTEDSTGHAVPEADKYIKDCDLESAEKLVAACPTHALSIEETADVVLNTAELSDALEKELKSIQIPRITHHDIKFNESDYTIDYGYISGEDSYSYSSKSKAREAGQSRFRATFWNHRKDFALSYLAQYKSKVLRKFYDFTDPSKTYYSHFDDQFEKILKEAKAKLSAASGTDFSLPDDFAEFRPELSPDFQSNFSIDSLRDIDSTVYVNEFFEGFEKNHSQCLSYYEDCIYSHDDVQVIGTDWLGNNKIKTTYCFRNANNTGKELVHDIGFSLRCASSCGMRCVDKIAAEHLNSIIGDYRDLIAKDIQNKVSVFKSAVETLYNLQGGTDMETKSTKQIAENAMAPECPAPEAESVTPVASAITDTVYHLLGKSIACQYDRSIFAETNDYLVYLNSPLVDDIEDEDIDWATKSVQEYNDYHRKLAAAKRNDNDNCEICGIHKTTGATVQIDLHDILGSQWKILFENTNYCTQENIIYIPVLYQNHNCKILFVDFDTQVAAFLKPVFLMNDVSEVHLSISANLLVAFLYDKFREDDDNTYKAFLVDLAKEERAFLLMPKIDVADIFAYDGQILVLGCNGELYTYNAATRECKTYVNLGKTGNLCRWSEYIPVMYKIFRANGAYLFIVSNDYDSYTVYRLTKEMDPSLECTKVCISNGRLLCISECEEDGDCHCFIENYDLSTVKEIKEPELKNPDDFPDNDVFADNLSLLGDYLYLCSGHAGDSSVYKINLKENSVWEYI